MLAFPSRTILENVKSDNRILKHIGDCILNYLVWSDEVFNIFHLESLATLHFCFR